MNNDLISREALLQQIGEKLNVLRGCNDFKEAWGMRYAMVMIQNAPAADAVEVVHGRWLDRPKNQGWKDEEIGTVGMVDGEPWSSCYCSECGEWLVASDEYSVKGNFCPNCGADMRGESNE